jgi:hypothetical protein
VAILAVVALLGLNCLGLANYYQTALKPDWRTVAEQISELSDNNDALVFPPQYERFPFDYYFRQQNLGTTLNTYAVWSENGVSTLRMSNRGKLTDISSAEFQRKHHRAWLILSTPWASQPFKSMFEPIGKVQQWERIGDVTIFKFEGTNDVLE